MAKFKLADGSGEITLKHVVEDKDRHGNVRLYYRRPGHKKVRLREKPGTDEFLAEYRAAASGKLTTSKTPAPAPKNDSLEWLVRQ